MIDYLSDTVTLPTAAMRHAMFDAPVGDCGYDEDPTVTALEQRAAELTGKEAAAFVTSGTMGNLTALLAHCPRGHEVILGDQSDLYHYEAGGISVVGGAVLHPVATADDGSLPLALLRRALRDQTDEQCAPPGVLALESPHCLRGGRVLSLAYLREVRALAQEHGVPVHLDGARLFNAQVWLGVPAADIVRHVDSVQFCLSKGLGAPYGSMVCGSRVLIAAVRRHRKMLGGGLRQGGIMAAAGLVALDSMIDRLAEDHRRAARLRADIQERRGLALTPADCETNMIFFDVAQDGLTNGDFVAALRRRAIRMGVVGDGRIRAVVHHMIDDQAIEQTVAVMEAILRGTA